MNFCPNGRCSVCDRTPGKTIMLSVDPDEGSGGLGSDDRSGVGVRPREEKDDDRACGVSTGASESLSAVSS